MSGGTKVNLDTCIIFNYLHSTRLPKALEESIGEEVKFESDEDVAMYFDDNGVDCIIGGKVKTEVENAKERRLELYGDVLEFIRTDERLEKYNPKERDIHVNGNDIGHLKRNVKPSFFTKSKSQQYSIFRKMTQIYDEVLEAIINTGIDDKKGDFTHDGLKVRIDRDLNIGHDSQVLVDAACICRKHDVCVLLSLDSDITDNNNKERFNELVKSQIGEEASVTVYDPRNHTIS